MMAKSMEQESCAQKQPRNDAIKNNLDSQSLLS